MKQGIVKVQHVLFQEVQIGGGKTNPEMVLRAYVHGEIAPEMYQQAHEALSGYCSLNGLSCVLNSLDGKVSGRHQCPKVNFQIEADTCPVKDIVALINNPAVKLVFPQQKLELMQQENDK